MLIHQLYCYLGNWDQFWMGVDRLGKQPIRNCWVTLFLTTQLGLLMKSDLEPSVLHQGKSDSPGSC
jgi:hypothetical protein